MTAEKLDGIVTGVKFDHMHLNIVTFVGTDKPPGTHLHYLKCYQWHLSTRSSHQDCRHRQHAAEQIFSALMMLGAMQYKK